MGGGDANKKSFPMGLTTYAQKRKGCADVECIAKRIQDPCRRTDRLQRSSTAAQLRHENAELIRIIADFDARLATVEAERDTITDTCKRTHELCVKWQEETRKVVAERDALQQRLDSLSNMPVVELPKYRRIVRNGMHVRDII